MPRCDHWGSWGSQGPLRPRWARNGREPTFAGRRFRLAVRPKPRLICLDTRSHTRWAGGDAGNRTRVQGLCRTCIDHRCNHEGRGQGAADRTLAATHGLLRADPRHGPSATSAGHVSRALRRLRRCSRTSGHLARQRILRHNVEHDRSAVSTEGETSSRWSRCPCLPPTGTFGTVQRHGSGTKAHDQQRGQGRDDGTGDRDLAPPASGRLATAKQAWHQDRYSTTRGVGNAARANACSPSACQLYLSRELDTRIGAVSSRPRPMRRTR